MSDKLRGPRQFLSVPNNVFGRLFIWAMRRWMNSKSYKLTLRGRGLKKSARKLYPLYKWDAEKRESYIAPGWRVPDPIPARYGKRIGIYFDAREPFCKLHHKAGCSSCRRYEWQKEQSDRETQQQRWVAQGVAQERERRARQDTAMAGAREKLGY